MSVPSVTPWADCYLKIEGGFIPGAQLVFWLKEIIGKSLSTIGGDKFNNHVIRDVITAYIIDGGEEWLHTAGHMAEFIPKCDVSYKQEWPLELFIGPKRTMMGITLKDKTERLYLSNADFSYRQIHEYLVKIKQEGFSDSVIANCILQKMQGKLAPDNLKNHEPFFDFLNTLLFGLEASRNNLCFGTSIMFLQLIQNNMMSFTDAFNKNLGGKGGEYPMASVKSDTTIQTSGNMSFRSTLITIGNAEDTMKVVFEDERSVEFHQVLVKEMRLLVKWLQAKRPIIEHLPFNEAKKVIDYEFNLLLKEWYTRPG